MRMFLPKRRLIPRWRPIAATLKKTEASSTDKREVEAFTGTPEALNEAISLWRESKAPGMLGDVLSFSVHPNLLQDVIKVGHEALQTGATVTTVQSALIRSLLEDGNDDPTQQDALVAEGTPHPYQQPIRRLRALLRVVPDNTLALLDYAQLQVAVGKPKAAGRSLLTALNLAPNNRLVIRTLARYFVHCQQPEIAHRLIYRHARTPSDPWLMASEIALADAANLKSSFISKGKRFLLDQSKFSPAHLTELAGAVAIEEMCSGNLKKAREAQRKALLAPNDNVIAQALEQEEDFGIHLDSPQVKRALSASSEALTIQAYSQFLPEDVNTHALAWHNEEPFSSRPIQLLATNYAYMGRFEDASHWSSAGLLADPEDFGLLVSVAYAQAQLGQIPKAEVTMRKMRYLHSSKAEPYCRATEGLIAYQQQRFEAGDALYDLAVAMFNNKSKQEYIGAFCRLNQVLSALDYGHPQADEITRIAKAALEAHPSTDSYMLLKIRSTLNIEESKAPVQRKRRLSQWVFDPSSNTLTEKLGITAASAQPLIILERK